ncbi:5-formyltetrahydrofolate cyclo-ligase [Ihubacter sp. rT4E-8]|uniref:5-formyltetrahydrofolate cyclo-ligase n=1 Tax=Ihubacter sp. rT4E-8 TaxID=3242369 RepID=UPI003CF06F89
MERDALRKEKIRARNSLTPIERKALSNRISCRIAGSEEFRRAETILLYKGVRGEVRLDLLEEMASKAGKRLSYPLCIESGEMIALIPEDETAWKKGSFGILEPVRQRAVLIAPQSIDLVLCPCTVFDRFCGRMGMGGGYYDRYLPMCENACIAAVAFEVQRAAEAPMESWDRPMDMVFTEAKCYIADGGRYNE